MAGRAYQASAFAASLRRHLFRKHIGLIKPQDMSRPDANFEPVGESNVYDWGSPEDLVVSDPLSPTFDALWNSRARTNTEVFHCVPDDSVTTWGEYKEFFEYFFRGADLAADGAPEAKGKTPPKYKWGHVVREDFPEGPEGVRQVKELLSQVKGSLVEMPLMFLASEDVAKEGLKLNPLTVEVYT
jgi:phospholipase D1/2